MYLPAWRDLGRFREDFFIDAIDHEFCLRARQAGYRVGVNLFPSMDHKIGFALPHDDWVARIIPYRHHPVRKYTIARNTLRLILEYAFREPSWSLRRTTSLIVELLSIIFLEPEKGRRLRAFLHGLRDGWRNRMGPIPSELLDV